MDCPSCGHPNPAAARFCGSCAAPLGGWCRCPSCGASNPRGQKFCNACAQSLADGEATLAVLAESYLGLGGGERARTLAQWAVQSAHGQANRLYEPFANIALARVLLGSTGPVARAEIQASLARALALACDTDARAYEPMVHFELAGRARQSGEEEECQRELREARRLFAEIGATGRLEHLASELATPASEMPSR